MKPITLISIFSIIQFGCASLAHRIYDKVDPTVLEQKKPLSRPSLSVILYADAARGDTLYELDGTGDLELIQDELSELNWFSQVNVSAKQKLKPKVDLIKINLDSFEGLIEDSNFDTDYQLTIFFRYYGADIAFKQNILCLLTFCTYPAREDHSFTIGFKLRSKNDKSSEPDHTVFLKEQLQVLTTWWPNSYGERLGFTLKAPVMNLAKVALLKFREQGLLR